MQHAREEEIAERKAMKRAERDIARKKEFVRRVRLQIEEKRAEVRFSGPPPVPPPLPEERWSLVPALHSSVDRVAIGFSQCVCTLQVLSYTCRYIVQLNCFAPVGALSQSFRLSTSAGTHGSR